VTRVHLVTKAEVAGLEAEAFQEFAEEAKANCPISRALAGVEITLEASLS
ncbi:MAG: peroxiredoxin, partial [Chloroflexi bacterium]